MSKRSGIRILGSLSFVLILVLCLKFSLSDISTRISHAVALGIAENGFDEQEFSLDGRDVVFTGEVSEQLNRVGLFSVVRGIPGVRNIIDEQVLYKVEPAVGVLKIQGDRLDFYGVFENHEKHQALRNLIERHFSNYKVQLKSELSHKVAPMQQNLNFEEIFKLLNVDNFSFAFSDKEIQLNGVFPSQQKMRQLEDLILNAIDDETRYNNNLRIIGKQSTAHFKMQKTDNVILISGKLSDTQVKDKLITLLKAYYPNFKFDIKVKVDTKLDDVGWVNYISLLIPELDRFIEGSILVNDQSIFINALVDAVPTKVGLLSRVGAAVDGFPVINTIQVQDGSK